MDVWVGCDVDEENWVVGAEVDANDTDEKFGPADAKEVVSCDVAVFIAEDTACGGEAFLLISIV